MGMNSFSFPSWNGFFRIYTYLNKSFARVFPTVQGKRRTDSIDFNRISFHQFYLDISLFHCLLFYRWQRRHGDPNVSWWAPLGFLWPALTIAIHSQLQSLHDFSPKDLTTVRGSPFQSSRLQEIISLCIPGVGALTPLGSCPPKCFA
jgi:hypothetical protein